MNEQLLSPKTNYSKNIIISKSNNDKHHFKSYDDLISIDDHFHQSDIAINKECKSKSENTLLLTQYQQKRASKAEEELFDYEEDESEPEEEEQQIQIDDVNMYDESGAVEPEEDAEYIIEKQMVNTLLSPPIIIRAPSQSSSINSHVLHYRKHRGASFYRKIRKRAIDKNGNGNIIQINISKRRRKFLQDIFTTLVDVKWRWTLLVCSMGFILSWLGFACLWWLLALTHGDLELSNTEDGNFTPCVSGVDSFAASFLFSIETQHTIGYGTRSTNTECPEAIILMCVQSIFGCLVQAFTTGLVFAKMARPKQRTQTLLFSKTAVINQRDGYLCLMFRVGDMREKSHLIGATVTAYLLRQRTTKEGEILSPFLSELKVHIDNYDSDILLLWPMVIVHRIDEESPLYNMSAQILLHEKFEVILTLQGTTESTGQTTQAKTSYLPSEILWGHRFEPLVTYNKEKIAYQVDYALFHNTNQVDTPLCSANELNSYTQYSKDERFS